MSKQNRRLSGSIVTGLVGIFTLLIAGWLILNHQYALDQWNVWQYQPSAQIATIASRDDMSDKGKFYFYTSHPAVESAQAFNANCQRQEATSAILGCYSLQKIHIYNVTNSQLDGIEEVTAAHETLHAVWDRMSLSDQQSVGILLEAAYQKINDPALKDRMAYYDRAEPGDHDNELHSILGTEVANVGPALEAHYAQYFNNRSQVVALHTSYQQVFDSNAAQADALKAELTTLGSDLNANIVQYNTSTAALNADSDALRNSASLVDRTNAAAVNQFNATRQSLINRINQLETLRATIGAKEATYNSDLDQYNKLAVRSNQLEQSIDSSLASAPSL